MRFYIAAAATSIALAASPCAAGVEIYGTWSGKCTRPGHPDNIVDLEIAKDGSIQFFHKPTTNDVLNYPQIQFSTAAGNAGTIRHFSGTAQNNGKVITGSISDPDGISINCTLNETS